MFGDNFFEFGLHVQNLQTAWVNKNLFEIYFNIWMHNKNFNDFFAHSTNCTTFSNTATAASICRAHIMAKTALIGCTGYFVPIFMQKRSHLYSNVPILYNSSIIASEISLPFSCISRTIRSYFTSIGRACGFVPFFTQQRSHFVQKIYHFA